jgi:serralysin
MANNRTVTATHDYRPDLIGVVDNLTFSTSAAFPDAIFDQSQLSTTLAVTPDSNYDHITVFVTAAAFSAAGWSLPSWDWGLVDIEGTAGAETISGSASFNIIHGGGGADWLIGGNGGNTFVYTAGSEIAAGELVVGGTGLDELAIGAGSYDFSAIALSSIERLRIDNFSSSATLVTLNGSQVAAGAIYTVDAEHDTGGIDLTVRGSSVNLSTVSFTGWNTTATDRVIIIGTAGADTLIGSSQADVIRGGRGADTLQGGPGGDGLIGGRGADLMIGDGDDTYYVDNAGDVVQASPGGIIGNGIYASISFSLADPVHCNGTVYYLTLTGTGNINGTGNGLGNSLIGNGGNNVLSGRGGDDTEFGLGGADLLAGGDGNDTLSGGPGNDRFRFATALNAATNLDHITDFAHLQDTFSLKHAIFAAIAAGALAPGAFHLGTDAGDGDDRIVYDRPNGRLYYDPDGSGAQGKVQFAVLDNHAVLTSADFLVA